MLDRGGSGVLGFQRFMARVWTIELRAYGTPPHHAVKWQQGSNTMPYFENRPYLGGKRRLRAAAAEDDARPLSGLRHGS